MRDLPANFWRLLGASGASNLADGVFFVVLPLMALRFTDAPVLIAGLALVGRLPWLVFVLVAGALADRLDRRATMRNVQLFRVALLGTLAILALTGGLSLPILYVAALLLGIGETLFDTAAQSILPSIVDRDRLATANGRLYGVELVANQFVGPPLGGLLIAVSIPIALGVSVAGYALAALGLALLVGSFRPVREGPRTRITSDIAEGLRYLFAHRVLRTLAMMVGVLNLASAATGAIFVLYAVAPGPMGLSEPEFGILITSFAIGSLGGSLLAARLERRFGRVPLLFACVVVSAVGIAVPAFTTNAWLVGLSFAVTGLFIVVWNVITVSLRQRIVPDHLLGRLNAAYRLLAWGSQPIGALLGGVVGAWLGLPAVFIGAGLLGITLLATRVVLTERAIADAEASGTAAPVAA
jgi:MFS family permease